MEKKTKARGNNKSQSSFEQELGPLVKAIDDAVASIPDARQRQEVREAVGQAVHSAIQQLATRPASSQRAIAPTAIGDATTTAADAVSRVKDLGFVAFTTGLIDGTFNAITTATVKQMQAYADLVASLAKSLTEFQAENVTTAEINSHLANQYPDGSGGTSIRTKYIFKATPEDADKGIPPRTAKENLTLVGEALVRDTSTLLDPAGAPLLTFDPDRDSVSGSGGISFTSEWVKTARNVVGRQLARNMIEHLRAMAREGMARIVITNGELLSKLTFRVESSEVEQKRESDYRSERMSASVRTRFGGGFFGASLNASYDSMKVTTVDTESFDSVTMSAEIIGQVKLNFRTETFTPVVKDGPIV
ncbi:hypothetical protein [Vitiosangium sp. GDMCC 1.1324]|uniref:hypothetical protein n=1 Tax=Vitiosangium sp. (strain GDMCC 1.1324) TaxID=2138576 RepID=UPI000D3C7694|nr:hypothetical protein [Vitiosangium sp. GDMCC 1.1324]PTL85502.1 hypothetical protein DAT35_01925 [Vitiosangium sp. GDMCC 1.1324]